MAFRVEKFDHSADIGITVYSDSLEELFNGAAFGMLGLLIDNSEIESRAIRVVSASARSRELLLVNFLAEILDLVLYDRFAALEVKVGELNEGFVVAEASGQKTIPPNSIIREIKGVTYHMLSVTQTPDGGYEARIIFDL